LQQVIGDTVRGLGLDLVDVERSAGGLLRVTVDWPWSPASDAADADAAAAAPQSEAMAITVDDCERVTRQLQYVLEVQNVDYRRLEVSSPGIDRPLRHALDFERFLGEVIDITLKDPVGSGASAQAVAAGAPQQQVAANRKKFRGVLRRSEQPSRWRIVWQDAPRVKPGQRVSARRAPPPEYAMDFELDELKEARLAPVVNFKGRRDAATLQKG
jgi:ribosome maturation factor RimP